MSRKFLATFNFECGGETRVVAVTRAGRIACLHHASAEVRRELLLHELGGRTCPCVAHFRRLCKREHPILLSASLQTIRPIKRHIATGNLPWQRMFWRWRKSQCVKPWPRISKPSRIGSSRDCEAQRGSIARWLAHLLRVRGYKARKDRNFISVTVGGLPSVSVVVLPVFHTVAAEPGVRIVSIHCSTAPVTKNALYDACVLERRFDFGCFPRDMLELAKAAELIAFRIAAGHYAAGRAEAIAAKAKEETCPRE